MANTLSPVELVSDRLESIHKAMDALFKHTNKAVDIRTRADRTTNHIDCCANRKVFYQIILVYTSIKYYQVLWYEYLSVF